MAEPERDPVHPVSGMPVSAGSNAVLRARMEELAGAYQRMIGQTRRLHEEAAKVTGSAESDDGMVKATVGPRGQVVSLTLDPRSSRRVGAEELARVIVATVNKAGQDARSRTAALLDTILPPGMSAAGLVDGSTDPTGWMPSQPLTDDTVDGWLSTVLKPTDPGVRR